MRVPLRRDPHPHVRRAQRMSRTGDRSACSIGAIAGPSLCWMTRSKDTNGTHAVSAVIAASRPITVCGSAAIAHPSTAHPLTVSTHSRFSAELGFAEPATPIIPPCSSGPMFLVSMMNTHTLITPLSIVLVCLPAERSRASGRGAVPGPWNTGTERSGARICRESPARRTGNELRSAGGKTNKSAGAAPPQAAPMSLPERWRTAHRPVDLRRP